MEPKDLCQIILSKNAAHTLLSNWQNQEWKQQFREATGALNAAG